MSHRRPKSRLPLNAYRFFRSPGASPHLSKERIETPKTITACRQLPGNIVTVDRQPSAFRRPPFPAPRSGTLEITRAVSPADRPRISVIAKLPNHSAKENLRKRPIEESELASPGRLPRIANRHCPNAEGKPRGGKKPSQREVAARRQNQRRLRKPNSRSDKPGPARVNAWPIPSRGRSNHQIENKSTIAFAFVNRLLRNCSLIVVIGRSTPPRRKRSDSRFS
jgi:hypothetical protein